MSKVKYFSANLSSLIEKITLTFSLKCMKIRKLKIEIMSDCIAQFIEKMHCQVSPLSYTINTKTILF